MRGIININKRDYNIEYLADDKLLDLLRKLGFSSVRKGCETVSCSVCTILIDNKPVNSCAVYVARVVGKKVTTVEGVEAEARKIAEFISGEGVDQCGYCAPGFVMTLLGLKNEIKEPTEDKILEYFRGNLCRCSGYEGQLRAIKKYLEVE